MATAPLPWIDEQLLNAPVAYRRFPAAQPAEVTQAGLAPLVHQVIDVATAASHKIAMAIDGASIALHELVLWNAAVDQTILLEDDIGTRYLRLTTWPAATGFTLRDNGLPIFTLPASRSLMLTLSAAGQVDGYIRYRVLEQNAS